MEEITDYAHNTYPNHPDIAEGFTYGVKWVYKQPLYAFVYSDSPESSAATMSLHRTRKGAELAMEFHKEAERKEFERLGKEYDSPWNIKFGEQEFWGVQEIKIQE